MGLTRRRFIKLGALGVGAAVTTACTFRGQGEELPPPNDGRLKSRPGTPTGSAAVGRQSLGLGGGGRDGLLYVPSGYKADTPAPLVVMLHGAGGSSAGGIRPFEALADARGMILLAPDSRASSWDVRFGEFGPDVAFIDAALAVVFRTCNVDPARVGIEGFSDGASYSLSLGLSNGDLFRRVVAFSPGFKVVTSAHGKPPVFISHGTADTILDINQTSRRLVPELRTAGYTVTYHEFTGPHTVPGEIAAEAADWLASTR